MLRVHLDDHVADGAAHLDKTPTAEHGATSAQPAGKPPLTPVPETPWRGSCA